LRARRTVTLLGALSIAAGALTATAPVLPVAAKDSILKQVAKGEFKTPIVQTKEGARKLPALSGSLVEAATSAFQARGSGARAQAQAQSRADGAGSGLAASPTTLGCGQRNTNGNVRVNQDCTFRRQAEESIAFNPADPNNLIAGQNDSRIGYNHCGFDYSLDAGKTWGDGLPPFWQHTNSPQHQEPIPTDNNRHTMGGGPGSFHTYDAASDPIVAADSKGRAFFGCVAFDLYSNANALIVTQSPAGAGGSFYDNVPDVAYDFSSGAPVPILGTGRRFIVVEDNDGVNLHDKPFLTTDFVSNGLNRDNVYVTWTDFRFDQRCVSQDNPSGQCDSVILGSMSTTHGLTWSTPEVISGISPVCVAGTQVDPLAAANACNQDQGSDPIVRPDGSLVVVFNNTNGTHANPAQQLAAVCHPAGSTPNGSAHLNCSNPNKVGDDHVTGEPQCDFGRGPEECVPGAYIRTNDFPRIAVNRGNGNLYATWQDYRTGQYDIQLARSTDGGHTWTQAAAPVNPDQTKDHYMPAIGIVASGNGGNDEGNGADHVAVSYYRTDRVPNENGTPACPTATGLVCFAPGQPGVKAENSDYDLSGGNALDTPYAAQRISPIFPPPDGNQTGFNGDYSGLTVVGNIAHPIWSDTRNTVPQVFASQPPGQGTVHDEDVFTTARPVPSGHGEQD
jgi:hypothetical protein